MENKKQDEPRYTCTDYRMEMILLSLERRLHHPDISQEEEKSVREEIEKIKDQMKMT